MILKEYGSKIGLMKLFTLILLILVSSVSNADSWVTKSISNNSQSCLLNFTMRENCWTKPLSRRIRASP